MLMCFNSQFEYIRITRNEVLPKIYFVQTKPKVTSNFETGGGGGIYNWLNSWRGVSKDPK